MPERRFTFHAMAELYDRARPGYPAALFADLIALSGIGTAARLLAPVQARRRRVASTRLAV